MVLVHAAGHTQVDRDTKPTDGDLATRFVVVASCPRKMIPLIAERDDNGDNLAAEGHHDEHDNEADEEESTSHDKQNLYWSQDGRDGRDDANNSERILIQWLATPGNWAVYRVAKADGKLALRTATSKMQHCQHLSALIREAGSRVERTPKKIRCKIEYLEKQFWRAHEWVESEAGQQLLPSNEAKYHARLRRTCPHYDALKDVMIEAAASDAVAAGGTTVAVGAVAVGGDVYPDAAAADDDDVVEIEGCAAEVADASPGAQHSAAKRPLVRQQDDPELARLKRRREQLEVQKLEIDIKAAKLQYQVGRLKEYDALRRDAQHLYAADEIRRHVPALADLVKDGHFRRAAAPASAPPHRAP
jgi:hypothetical protein